MPARAPFFCEKKHTFSKKSNHFPKFFPLQNQALVSHAAERQRSVSELVRNFEDAATPEQSEVRPSSGVASMLDEFVCAVYINSHTHTHTYTHTH